VRGDPQLPRIVLENCLGNAWKFTAQRLAAQIEFGVRPRDGRPAYFVRDNGAGFDMAYVDKLFAAFQRLPGATEFPGTGIGASPPCSVSSTVMAAGSGRRGPGPRGDLLLHAVVTSGDLMRQRVILLVEDNPDDEALTRRALAKNNIHNEVVVAHDGAEAVDYLLGGGARADASVLPEVVLLDLKLPKVDGLEVLRRIRADQRTRLLPVVILTSSTEERDLAQGYGLGANSYIRKPVDFNQFVEAVRQLGLYWLVLNEPPPR
jgi:CheY-like chemotaxis protein